jgi:hypothetical protein
MPPIAIPPKIVDCGSDRRVDHARGPATFYVKRVYPTRSDIQAILDAAATGPAVIIWPSAGQDVSSHLWQRRRQCAVPASYATRGSFVSSLSFYRRLLSHNLCRAPARVA